MGTEARGRGVSHPTEEYPMPSKDHLRVNIDPSSEAMLAEHERLAALYLHNAETGEKRTSHYLTVISAGMAVLLGLAQLCSDKQQVLGPAIGLLVGLLISGLVTFHRLIERRVRATEYLRAINRIHRYFVDLDPALAPHYYWPCCDDAPSSTGSGSALTGLRDVVALQQSLCRRAGRSGRAHPLVWRACRPRGAIGRGRGPAGVAGAPAL